MCPSCQDCPPVHQVLRRAACTSWWSANDDGRRRLSCAGPGRIARCRHAGRPRGRAAARPRRRDRRPAKAARNIESALRPGGGVAYVSTPWSQAFHATPDDYWRFSVRGLMLMFERLEVLSSFYSGGDVGLDVAYRVVRDGKPELDP